MNIEDAVQSFREAAIAKDDFATPAEQDHALHKRMAEALKMLKGHGSEGRYAFRALLADSSPHVRLWVASQLLSEGESGAAEVIEAEVAAGGIHGFRAEMVLKEWRAGQFRPPFGTQ